MSEQHEQHEKPKNKFKQRIILDVFKDPKTCMVGCCFPCVLVNKTSDLLHHKEPSCCGLAGCGWCCLNMCGPFGGVFTCLQRGKIRTAHGIGGNEFCDLMWNLFCPCCAIIQQYKEVEHGVDTTGYQKNGEMRA